MTNKPYIAIIHEGIKREPQILYSITSIFFDQAEFRIIPLPAEQNIYMLWSQLKQDDFETDVIEVIRGYSDTAAKMLEGLTRDDFSEVYLFFDCDGHQDNIAKDAEVSWPEVLREMLYTFDNETELGKLYVSYPMAEALRDVRAGQCGCATQCLWPICDLGRYKRESAVSQDYQQHSKYTGQSWAEIMDVFAMRASCLFRAPSVFTFEDYRQSVNPRTIFDCQVPWIRSGQIFVLSAFPEFLLDYFPRDFWARNVVQRDTYRPEKCGDGFNGPA